MGCTSSNVTAVSGDAGAPTVKPSPGSQEKCFFAHYVLGEKLGKGGFAQVRAALKKVDGAQVAVKVLDLRRDSDDGECDKTLRRYAIEEAAAWKAAGQHANIVVLQDAYLDAGVCFFCMEVCDMSLASYLQAGAGEQHLTERGLSRLFFQVLHGVAHVHDQNVVHRDIKPDNFMIANDVVKLCDFGLASVLPSAGLTGVYGTAPFMPPEMLNVEKYGKPVDVWSVGVMAYVLIYGTFPIVPKIKTSTEMKKAIKLGEIVPKYVPQVRGSIKAPPVSDCAEAFVRSLLIREPKERATAKDAMSKPWLKTHQLPQPPQATQTAAAPFTGVLALALKSGAFEFRPVVQDDERLDRYLQAEHLSREGVPLPLKGKDKKERRFSKSSSDSAVKKTVSDASTKSSSTAVSKMSSNASSMVNWQTSNMSPGGRHFP